MNQHFVNKLALLIVLITVSCKLYGNSLPSHTTEKIIKNNHLIMGAGWAGLGIRDMGLSPLYYSGSHFYGTVGYQKSSDNFLSAFNIRVLYGSVYPDIYPDLTDSGMKSIKAGGGYSYMRFAGLFADGEGKLFIGGTLDSQLGHYKHHKFTNSATNQFSITTLGFSGQASYSLERGQKNYLLVFNVHMPLVAAIVRNGYAYIKPPGFLEHETGNIQSFFKSIDYLSLNKFFSIESVLSLEYRMKNENIWRIGYRWEYFGHDNANTLKSATHGVFIQKMLNF